MATKGKGKAYQWILSHVDYPHADHCLTWPLSTLRGYGRLGHLGKGLYAHSMMCELVHGERPSPRHQAAHSCGKGNEGCVNPRHLSWKTQSENELDKFEHGTAHQLPGRPRTKLTLDDVAEIRRLAPTTTHEDLAARFSVGRSTIGAILTGRSWNTDRNKHLLFMPADDAKIRQLFQEGHTGAQISRIMDRHSAGIYRRLKMMGFSARAERE